METWNFINNKYSAGIPVILLYVLESKGSSPGRQGFKMAVAADGDFCGTIGGGIMEHKFVEMAKVRLQQNKVQQEVYKQVHDKSAGHHQSGMICSGEQTVFLYPIQPPDIAHIETLISALQNNKNGTLTLSPNGISFSGDVLPQEFNFVHHSHASFFLQQRTGNINQLHIIGGGHCALALCRLMRTMDFTLFVYDERRGLNTMAENEYAHHKIITDSYESIGETIEEGDYVYVVIMTFGYRTDDIALRALLGKKFKYMGVLGSKNKIGRMFAQYRKENIPESILEKIHAPVGIQVKSQTTAEIAVSIAAEIIGIKNKDQ